MAQSAVQVRVADPLFQIIGHEEDSNPRRSDRRDTRSNTGVPDHFQGKRQEVTGKIWRIQMNPNSSRRATS
jgi:hypothetical protein